MSDPHEYRLRIDVFRVETLPMARLAEYMAELSRLLGNQERVHFSCLEPGSTVLVSRVDDVAVSMVGERLRKVREGLGAKDAMQAFKALDNLLAKDNATGNLTGDGAEIMDFRGHTRPKPIRYGPFNENGSLDGVVIRLGGRNDMIPVHLEDAEGVVYQCQANVEISKQLSRHYRGSTVRVYGRGRWDRGDVGVWTLVDFTIDSFDVLDDSPLTNVVAGLRSIKGGDWNDNIALGDAHGLRGEDGPSH